MRTRQAVLCTGWAVLVILASSAFAGAPMGPPTAYLGEGQWGVGFEYGYEEIDMRACGTGSVSEGGTLIDSFDELFQIDGLESNMFFGNLAYGICDNWDVFVRLGAADAQDDVITGPGEDPITFDGSYGFAWGVGTRATFCRSGPWSFGGLIQATWFDPDDGDFTQTDGSDVLAGDLSADYWQTQVALAAMYQMDTWRAWVGPYLQFIDGDFDLDADLTAVEAPTQTYSFSMDLKQESEIGAHGGIGLDVTPEFTCWVEGQFTSDSWLVGIGGVFHPEEAFGGM